ncbi:MAG: BlaI/MecI/CopY family transcriptional regulator [Methanomicrobia archaeon]|nr:BlaI/MecI/CopY family transcriptional regulator [Methanomicrobia archaeon]
MRTIEEYIKKRKIVELDQLKEWYKKNYKEDITTHKISGMIKEKNIVPIYSLEGRKVVGYGVYDVLSKIEGINLIKKGVIASVEAMKTINKMTDGAFDKYRPFYRAGQNKIRVPKLPYIPNGLHRIIMNRIWIYKKEVSAKELYDELHKIYGGDRRTYSKYLLDLFKRGFLERRKAVGLGGYKYLYRPKISKSEYEKMILNESIRK